MKIRWDIGTETKYLFTSTYYKMLKKQLFVRFLSLLRFIVTRKFELLGILGTFKMAEQSYPISPHSKPCSLIVQTSRSRGQHLCSKFAKIPHLGCARTFKVPTSPLGPPFDITLIAALQLGVTCVGFNCFRSSIVTFLAFKVTYRIAFLFKL